ncbi:MAG: phenylalanine--tRNA ligase subunit alpha [Candidatus Omnitrophica bacterium]|nr:phenylalanine--tRNA ligase subunit alpha [Candidatus Omnitrophota bacterium]
MSERDIASLYKNFESETEGINSAADLEELRLRYLGRKGLIAELTGSIPTLEKSERAEFGKQVNALKNRIISLLGEKEKFLGRGSGEARESVDITMPAFLPELGHRHLITQLISEICGVFEKMGFLVIEGPEVETEYNNFTGLNIPLEHPSRDAFDTFYLKGKNRLLLRSHTSPVQIRVMKSRKPPLAVVVPGRVYRPDATDASHLFMFYQIEGFMVDTNIRFSDLKGTLEFFLKKIFGPDVRMRLRPHFFPFTEPSAEVDISCNICNGKGCSTCGRKGWLEILGAGMIHPNVLRNVGYSPKKYSGFAFGMGIERIAMLKYGIQDIRIFYENDLRFLKQF